MDVSIRPEAVDDYGAIRDVVGAAFSHQPGVADLPGLIRASPHYIAEFALVARRAGGVVGFVMISGADLIADDGDRYDTLTLSPLAVAPAHQGQGIGAALVRASLRAADDAGAGLVTLEGSPRYYGRLGFTHARDSGLEIPLPDWAPPEAAQVYRLRNYDPAVRGRLVYPPAFAAVGAAP